MMATKYMSLSVAIEKIKDTKLERHTLFRHDTSELAHITEGMLQTWQAASRNRDEMAISESWLEMFQRIRRAHAGMKARLAIPDGLDALFQRFVESELESKVHLPYLDGSAKARYMADQ